MEYEERDVLVPHKVRAGGAVSSVHFGPRRPFGQTEFVYACRQSDFDHQEIIEHALPVEHGHTAIRTLRNKANYVLDFDGIVDSTQSHRVFHFVQSRGVMHMCWLVVHDQQDVRGRGWGWRRWRR